MELDRQHLGGEARAAAGVAGDPDVGQEVHLDPLLPGPLAGLAPAAGHVEAEPARRVTADLGLGKLGEELADQVEHPGVGGRGRVGRRPQGRLVDADHLVDAVQALDGLVGPGGKPGAVQGLGGGLPEDVLDQRALARAADPRHDRDHSQRDADIEVLEIVLPRTANHDRRHAGRGTGWPAVGRHRDRLLAAEVLPGQRLRRGLDLLRRARGGDRAAELPRAGPEIDQVVGRLDDLAVVLDQDQRVAQVAQVPQGPEQPGVVARVQADRRLVEHVEHAGQSAADLAGQPDALALAAGERGRAAGQVR